MPDFVELRQHDGRVLVFRNDEGLERARQELLYHGGRAKVNRAALSVLSGAVGMASSKVLELARYTRNGPAVLVFVLLDKGQDLLFEFCDGVASRRMRAIESAQDEIERQILVKKLRWELRGEQDPILRSIIIQTIQAIDPDARFDGVEEEFYIWRPSGATEESYFGLSGNGSDPSRDRQDDDDNSARPLPDI